MKKLMILLAFSALAFEAYSQTSVMTTFNSVDIGRNVALSVKQDFKQHSVILGVKYGINSNVHDNQNNIYHKRFFANDFEEHIGQLPDTTTISNSAKIV